MEKEIKKNDWAIRGKVLWIYLKYQFLSKILFVLIVFPVFHLITKFFIRMSGRTNLSSGDYKGFVFSIYGLPAILLSFLLLIVVLGMDINAFIIISSLVEEGKLKMRIKNILYIAFQSLKHFFSPIGLFVVLFIAFVLPVLDIGINMSSFKNFKIPNFITSVIFNNFWYRMAYIVAFIVLLFIRLLYIFSLHFMIIDGRNIKAALKSSRKMVCKHWKSFLVDYFIAIIKTFFLFSAIFVTMLFLLIAFSYLIHIFYPNNNFIILLLLLSTLELFSLFAFLSVPIIISILTKLFFKYNKIDGKEMKLKLENRAIIADDEEIERKIKLKTKFQIIIFLAIVVSCNLLFTIFAENNFNQIFKTTVNMELVAHRGGGDLGAENTVEGIKEAIKTGVNWTEIDVQRTKDGYYVINHDPSFLRVAGVNKKPMGMTLEEIKKLEVKNEFYPDKVSQKVPTFEEILDVCKGKIGVFVELKGASADEKMVDDVVQMIKEKNMIEECVILSLNYKMIEYTSNKYPEIKTGFLCFFQTGALKDLKGDYLIMEEREASRKKLRKYTKLGKKRLCGL